MGGVVSSGPPDPVLTRICGRWFLDGDDPHLVDGRGGTAPPTPVETDRAAAPSMGPPYERRCVRTVAADGGGNSATAGSCLCISRIDIHGRIYDRKRRVRPARRSQRAPPLAIKVHLRCSMISGTPAGEPDNHHVGGS